MARYVVGITGASGVKLSHLAIDHLTSLGHFVELVISRDAPLTILQEMGDAFASPQKFLQSFSPRQQELISLHQINDFEAPIASGSFKHDGCLIIPCSMATLAAIAQGLSDNLIRRAADVTLKERRRLVIVPRETPLHEIHLENMLRLSRMGACVFPPEPAWYMRPESLAQMEEFMVSRILDQLGVDIGCVRWGSEKS
jgi:4-hydroxy-3-polyprenylbenzoate decarboxylase